MKTLLPLGLLVAVMFAVGCAPQEKALPVAPAAIVTPDNSPAGRVVSYNFEGRFVVLNFSAGQIPEAGQPLFLYRSGLKVAEVKITGPQRGDNIVADLANGSAQVGDEVRDQ